MFLFVILRKRSAHGADSAPLAAYELSWPVNSRWLYVEGLFMNQSKSGLASEQTSANHAAPTKDIVDTVNAAGNCTTFAAGIKAARLADTLAGKGPFTVFAPTEEAFKKLPAGALDALLKDSAKLKAVLNYHIIAGHVAARDMKSGDVMTLQGSALTAVVSGSQVQVNGAHVKRADMVATNGIIHEIDAVIMPKHWQLLATAA
jgi:uncharacterized surface protein with fasciclin (FAS1) repeats